MYAYLFSALMRGKERLIYLSLLYIIPWFTLNLNCDVLIFIDLKEILESQLIDSLNLQNNKDRTFPDSTRRGDAEAGANNLIQVELVSIPFS